MADNDLDSICVYCGANPGNDPVYVAAAQALGAMLASAGIQLVYGGGNVGLMGEVADAAMAAGGRVVGVIPQAIADVEIAHTGLTELHVVSNMHERKAMMAQRSDAFIVLPGGIGTLEEMFETWTWSQLGIHKKPIGLVNVNGYYNALLGFLDGIVGAGFLKPGHRATLLSDSDPGQLIERMRAAVSEPDAMWEGKWTQI